jgi:hypothetical protein
LDKINWSSYTFSVIEKMHGGSAMILCSNCSAENPEDAHFCKNCGNSLIIQSNVVEIKKIGNDKFTVLKSKEERLKKAKEMALKALHEVEYLPVAESNLVHLGEKII